MADSRDPVQIEIAKLSEALLGNRQKTLENLDESEKLARVARDSRPGMVAMKPRPITGRRVTPTLDAEVTAKFKALRGA